MFGWKLQSFLIILMTPLCQCWLLKIICYSSDGPTVDLTNDVFDNTIEIDGEPIIEQEPVIHPGGSQSVDYNKVSHIGVHTVVQVIFRIFFHKINIYDQSWNRCNSCASDRISQISIF